MLKPVTHAVHHQHWVRPPKRVSLWKNSLVHSRLHFWLRLGSHTSDCRLSILCVNRTIRSHVIVCLHCVCVCHGLVFIHGVLWTLRFSVLADISKRSRSGVRRWGRISLLCLTGFLCSSGTNTEILPHPVLLLLLSLSSSLCFLLYNNFTSLHSSSSFMASPSILSHTCYFHRTSPPRSRLSHL